MNRSSLMGIGWLILAVWIMFANGTISLPDWLPIPSIVSPVTATAATYIYEKDNGGVPPAVSAGLSELNAKGITATTFEEDTVDGSGQVPDQYKVSLPAAREVGLPALVVMAGETVKRVVKAPTTMEQVVEAAL